MLQSTPPALNCTLVELKFDKLGVVVSLGKALNCTLVELK